MEDNSSVSSEEDYSILTEESNHSTNDTALISSNVSLSNMSLEMDLEVLSRMVGSVTEQNRKRTKKNEEMRRQK
eukprot:6367002-Ditylum_brightwellii.AAC.1